MLSLEELNKLFDIDYFATRLLGAKIVEVRENYAKCTLEINENHKNAKNVVMGGAIFTLADFAFAVAANQNEDYFTVSTSANILYLRPAVGKYLTAETNLLKDGKMVCFYEISVYDDNNILIAKVNMTGTHVVKEK